MAGRFAAFVAVIIMEITNDLPAAQGPYSRISHETKDGRNAFSALLYEFTLLIAFLFLEM